jgi:UDP-N-acetylglucosamine/UDP-N-acetylgalactosamine diphosphorylase
MAARSLVVETKRDDEFAPIKNAAGHDSAKTSQLAQLERAKKWLRARGVSVADGARVEISPLSGACAEDLDASTLPKTIGSAEVVSI